jgi:hypothetical protein
MSATVITDRQLLASLKSDTCLGCGSSKIIRKTFCPYCYQQLSKQQQRALYDRIGHGYEEAVASALTTLKQHKPHLPKGVA